jgi:hydroxyacylglutathione hydrolase
VGGNLALKKRYGATIVGPRADAARIPGLDTPLGDGDALAVGGVAGVCYDTPGHTKGHVSFYFAEGKALFPGDTLFALGCGRLFEGDPPTMWASLSKLASLPRDTRVFCAHEYTQSNARWARAVDPDNEALAARAAAIDAARAKGAPTVPSLLGEELDTNPFLRPGDPRVRAGVGVGKGADDVAAFGAVRRHKDTF